MGLWVNFVPSWAAFLGASVTGYVVQWARLRCSAGSTPGTPLLERYEDQASAEGRSTQWEQEHAEAVLERVATFDRERKSSHEPDWYEFKHAVRRIELLSVDFIYDESAD